MTGRAAPHAVDRARQLIRTSRMIFLPDVLSGHGMISMAINSRTKGSSSEREFAAEVYQWSGIRLIRNLEQSRSGGHDLIVRADEVGPVADSFRSLAIECKRYAKVTPGLVVRWWVQARTQAEPNRLHPVLAYRGDRQDWQVIVPLYLINPAMSWNLGIESAAVLSVSGFCMVISHAA
jgi:hypothetical protein